MTLYDSLVEFGMEQGIEKGIEQGIQKGRAEGREEGIEQGETKAKREVILTGHKNGVTIQVLALMTGYSVEEVEHILEQG